MRACCRVESPLGRVLLVGTSAGLTHVLLPGDVRMALWQNLPEARLRSLLLGRAWLELYFAGLGEGSPLPPMMVQGTPFQLAVWREVARVPYGGVCTYGELARRLGGRGTSPRAVGQALGANPLCLLVPCHRVVAASGWGGFAAGVVCKQWLLRHEQTALA